MESYSSVREAIASIGSAVRYLEKRDDNENVLTESQRNNLKKSYDSIGFLLKVDREDEPKDNDTSGLRVRDNEDE